MSDMQHVLFLCLFELITAAYYEERFEQMKRDLSKMRVDMTWEFGLNEKFIGMSKEQLLSLNGATSEGIKNLPTIRSFRKHVKLPKRFDARKHWPQCKFMKLIRDQGNCGSCWAVSSASVMSDRHCVASNGTEQLYISDEYLLACCGQMCGNGCDGGSFVHAFEFWQHKGIPTGGVFGSKHSCQPYEIHGHSGIAKTPHCSHQCIREYKRSVEDDLHYGLRVYKFDGNVEAIMQDLYENGPVNTGFYVYEDYKYYKNGVYKHVYGGPLGGHAVRVIGWGEENGVPYWLIANSYNVTFGINGLMKFLRGSDHCSIESFMAAATANIRRK